MDPDTALLIATDPRETTDTRGAAAATVVAWVANGGFLPDTERFHYRLARWGGGWLVEERDPDGAWDHVSGVFSLKREAMADLVTRAYWHRDAIWHQTGKVPA